MNEVTVYHGTDTISAHYIQIMKILKSDKIIVCTTIERALYFSAIKCAKFGRLAEKIGRIIRFKIPEKVLKYATRKKGAFTLVDRKGDLIYEYDIEGDIIVFTISKAQKLLIEKKYTGYGKKSKTKVKPKPEPKPEFNERQHDRFIENMIQGKENPMF